MTAANISTSNHRSLLANFIAAAIFSTPSLLLFIPVVKDNILALILVFNAVIIFILISTVSHVKFKD